MFMVWSNVHSGKEQSGTDEDLKPAAVGVRLVDRSRIPREKMWLVSLSWQFGNLLMLLFSLIWRKKIEQHFVSTLGGEVGPKGKLSRSLYAALQS